MGAESRRWLPGPATLAALAACVVGLYALTGLRTWDADEYIYGSAAFDVLRGQSLYRTAWQDKPPLGILGYALPQLIAPHSAIGLQAFLGFCVLTQAAIICSLLPAHPRDRALIAALVVFLPFTRIDYVTLMTEHLSNLFIVLNFTLATRIVLRGRFHWWEAVVSGIATSLAFNTRQNSMLSGIAPLAAMTFSSQLLGRRIGGVAAWLTGALIGLIAVLGLLIAIGGDLAGYRYVVFDYPRLYTTADRSGSFFRPMVAYLVLIVPSSLILLLAIPYFALRGRHLPLILGLGAAAMIAGCLAPLKPFAHYMINVIPCVAVAWAAWAAQDIGSEPRFPWPLTAGIGVFLAISATAMAVLSVTTHGRHTELNAVCKAVDAAAGPDGTVFVVGQGAEYVHFHCRTPPAHTHYSEMQMNCYQSKLLPRPIDAVIADYLEHPPNVLAIGPPSEWTAMDGCERRATQLVDEIRTRHPYTLRDTAGGYQIYAKSD